MSLLAVAVLSLKVLVVFCAVLPCLLLGCWLAVGHSVMLGAVMGSVCHVLLLYGSCCAHAVLTLCSCCAMSLQRVQRSQAGRAGPVLEQDAGDE